MNKKRAIKIVLSLLGLLFSSWYILLAFLLVIVIGGVLLVAPDDVKNDFKFGSDSVNWVKVASIFPDFKSEYKDYAIQAGSICPNKGITPLVIVGQISYESSWKSNATSYGPGGTKNIGGHMVRTDPEPIAKGIAQFTDKTWQGGRPDWYFNKLLDFNKDGKTDPYDPADAIIAEGYYMCFIIEYLEKSLTDQTNFKDNLIDYALKAYNIGPYGFASIVNSSGKAPASLENSTYATRVRKYMNDFRAEAGSKVAMAAIAAARTTLGTPYVWGGTGTKGFDCSGLTQWAYAKAGISIPRTSREQYKIGTPVAVNQMAPGDLIFWAYNTSNPATIHHVAMYIGGGQMIAAPYTGVNVRIQPVYFKGLIGVKRPVS